VITSTAWRHNDFATRDHWRVRRKKGDGFIGEICSRSGFQAVVRVIFRHTTHKNAVKSYVILHDRERLIAVSKNTLPRVPNSIIRPQILRNMK